MAFGDVPSSQMPINLQPRTAPQALLARERVQDRPKKLRNCAAHWPKNLASAGLLWQRGGWLVDVTGRFVDRQFIDQLFAGTPTASTIKAYTVFDVGISRIIELAAASHAKFLKLSLNIDNIFDRRYLNTAFTDTDYSGNSFVRGIFGAPRTVTGSVSLGF